jgi:hypothetical protein
VSAASAESHSAHMTEMATAATSPNDALPDAIRRWLDHACPEGRVPSAVRIDMIGHIRLGTWLPFQATETIDRSGFVWAARVGHWPVRITGYDRYQTIPRAGGAHPLGAGSMHWSVGHHTLVDDHSPAVSRSAAWRFAAETLAWLPGTGPTTTWHRDGSCQGMDRPDSEAVVALSTPGADTVVVRLEVAPDGGLRSIGGLRWGHPHGRAEGEHSFGVDVLDEATFDGITIPSMVVAGWGWRTDWAREGAFFRARIAGATLRFG